ncbi:hypothetical protein RI367_005916 [Sorochytrium milnesiophthora]
MSDAFSAKGFVAGVTSGVMKLVVGHPFDTIKVRLQTEGLHGRFKTPWQCLTSTIRMEGVRALYKGATPPLFGWVVMDAVHFGTLNTFRNAQQNMNAPGERLTIGQHALAGFGTLNRHACADAQLSGTDRLTQNLLFRSNFWIMWGSCEVRVCEMPIDDAQMWYTRQLPKLNVPAPVIPFVAGGLAANTFWVFIYPADVVRNRLMAQPEPARGDRRPNIIDCARSIYRKEGIKAFYRGFVTAQLRSFPANGAALVAFQTSMRLMSSPVTAA